jgi:hypothetical protein
MSRLARSAPAVADLSRRGRTPLRVLLVLAAVTVVLGAAPALGGWRDPVVPGPGGLVVWLQHEHAYGLPRVRWENDAGTAAPAAPVAGPQPAANSALFTGSTEAEERSRAFSGPSDREVADRAAEPVRTG